MRDPLDHLLAVLRQAADQARKMSEIDAAYRASRHEYSPPVQAPVRVITLADFHSPPRTIQ